jgi:hypothetical protein
MSGAVLESQAFLAGLRPLHFSLLDDDALLMDSFANRDISNGHLEK